MCGRKISINVIIKKLEKGEKLSWEQLLVVFNDSDNKPISDVVYYLLLKLEGETRDLFVELINKDFRIEPSIGLSFSNSNPICFDGWSCWCVNDETKKFLLNFVPKESKKNDALNDFKNSLFEDILSK